jgi:uncharacterized membrane protein YeaQ/YmgE (transglycosylase-associated protein family)
MMHWLWTILIGFVAGLIAKAIMGGGPSGFIMTALLGIAGSLVATVIGQVTGLYGQGSGAGLIMSVAGAALLLFLYHKFGKK